MEILSNTLLSILRISLLNKGETHLPGRDIALSASTSHFAGKYRHVFVFSNKVESLRAECLEESSVHVERSLAEKDLHVVAVVLKGA